MSETQVSNTLKRIYACLKRTANAIEKSSNIPMNQRDDGIPVERLKLSTRALYVLRRCGVKTSADFKRLTIDTLKRADRCGEKTLNEIVSAAEEFNIKLTDAPKKDIQKEKPIRIYDLNPRVQTYEYLRTHGIRTLADLREKTIFLDDTTEEILEEIKLMAKKHDIKLILSVPQKSEEPEKPLPSTKKEPVIHIVNTKEMKWWEKEKAPSDKNTTVSVSLNKVANILKQAYEGVVHEISTIYDKDGIMVLVPEDNDIENYLNDEKNLKKILSSYFDENIKSMKLLGDKYVLLECERPLHNRDFDK